MTARRPSIDWMAALGVSLALGLLLVAASFTVGRHGFSPDEEITALVVRGIAETGAPVLPSGTVYLRGLPYSYAAWLGGALFGHELVVYRGVSLIFSLLAVVLIFLVTRAVSTPAAGVVAALLFAASPLLAGAAVFARFYAAFVAAALFAIWSIVKPRASESPPWPFLIALAVCRSLHEFAIVVAVFPACLALCERDDDPSRRRHVLLFAQSAALLLVMQIGLTAIEGWSLGGVALSSASGLGVFSHAPTAVLPLSQFALAGPLTLCGLGMGLGLLVWLLRRAAGTSWLVLIACAVCLFFFQTGGWLAVVVAALLARPREAGQILFSGLVLGAVGAGAWVLHTFAVTDVALSATNAMSVALSTAGYPWEAVWYLVAEQPAAVVFFAGTAVWAVTVPRFPNTTGLRALLLFGFASLMALGVSALEFQWRYTLLVLPFVLAGAASAVGTVSSIRWPRGTWTAWVTPLAAALVFVAAGASDLGALRSAGDSLVPTSAEFDDRAFRAATRTDDALICNDEMACRFLVGRADYWLLPRPDIASQYVVEGLAGPRSVYGGAAVLVDAAALHAALVHERRAVSMVVLDTGKFDYQQVREMAEALARHHGGAATAIGGAHLVVRLAAADRLCEGEEP